MLLLAVATMGAAELDQNLISTQDVKAGLEVPLKGWEENFETAVEKAKKRECPLLVAFLGPNWCEPSDLLESEVLSKKEFMDALKGELVFLKVDLPEEYGSVDFKAHPGVQLMGKFGVGKCPEMLLLEPDGKEIGRVKNLSHKGEAFASFVREMLRDYELLGKAFEKMEELNVDELHALYEKAGQFTDARLKEVVMGEGLKKDDGAYFMLEKYGERLARGKFANFRSKRLRSKIAHVDSDREVSKKLAVMDFDALKQIKGKSAKKVIRPIKKYLVEHGAHDSEAWKLELMLSQFLFGREELSAALEHAQASLELAPESARAEIAKSIEFLSPRSAVGKNAQ